MMGLLEDQWHWVLIVGGLLTAMFVGGWLQTGRRGPVFATIISGALTLLLLLIAHMVVTPREEVINTLHQIARDVERGDIPTIVAHIHPEAVDIRHRAEQEFQVYDIERVDIKNNLKVEMFLQHQPPKAEAEFNVSVSAKLAMGGEIHRVPRFVTVTFYKSGDRWLAYHYSHDDPRQGLLNRNDN